MQTEDRRFTIARRLLSHAMAVMPSQHPVDVGRQIPKLSRTLS
jgi:hypothetical protein